MTVDEIRELIQLVSESGVAELEVQRGENRVRIRRALGPESPAYAPLFYPPSTPLNAPSQAAAPSVGSPQGASQAAPQMARSDESTPDPSIQLVKSPIVGTFYESPSPDSPAFVRIGETVQAGRVLCIIESMKLMNEIEAEFAGVVESKLVPNGQPVEYVEALFAIRAI